jgi:hypothetical protein
MREPRASERAPALRIIMQLVPSCLGVEVRDAEQSFVALARATDYFVPAPTSPTTILRGCRARD